jgi:hypothetical protein
LLLAGFNMKPMRPVLKSLLLAALAARFATACGSSDVSDPDTNLVSGSPPGGGGGGGAAGNTVGTGGAGGTGGATADAVALAACSVLPEPPIVNLCVQPIGGWQDGVSFYADLSVQLSGTVTSVAKGPVPGGCFQSAGASDSEIVALTMRTELPTGTTDWNVEYQVPTNTVVWTVGDAVEVAYVRRSGGWSRVISELSLGRGQAADVYVGMGGVVADLDSAPLTFRQGSAICLQHDQCGDWSSYDLEAQDGSGWLRVSYGATISVGGYRITHGGLSEDLVPTTTCEDWFVSDVRVAALRDAN